MTCQETLDELNANYHTTYTCGASSEYRHYDGPYGCTPWDNSAAPCTVTCPIGTCKFTGTDPRGHCTTPTPIPTRTPTPGGPTLNPTRAPTSIPISTPIPTLTCFQTGSCPIVPTSTPTPIPSCSNYTNCASCIVGAPYTCGWNGYSCESKPAQNSCPGGYSQWYWGGCSINACTAPTPISTSAPTSTPIPTRALMPTSTPTFQSVTIQGHHVNSSGADFFLKGQGVQIGGGPINSSSPTWYFNTLSPASAYYATATPIAGYDIYYSLCLNCTSHSTYTLGNIVGPINVSTAGNYADIYFKYVPVSNPTPTTAPTTVTCSSLKSSYPNYFNQCSSYGKVCFNKYTSAYQGCGYSSYDDCTTNNAKASQNIWCDASSSVPNPTPTPTNAPTSIPVTTIDPSTCSPICTKNLNDTIQITLTATDNFGIDELWLGIAGQQPTRTYAEPAPYRCNGSKSCSHTWNIVLNWSGGNPPDDTADWTFWGISKNTGGTWSKWAAINVDVLPASIPNPTPTATPTTVTCSSLKSLYSNYFNQCSSYGKVCFNKYTSAYQGCGYPSYDDCTTNNAKASQNIWCDASSSTPNSTPTNAPTQSLPDLVITSVEINTYATPSLTVGKDIYFMVYVRNQGSVTSPGGYVKGFLDNPTSCGLSSFFDQNYLGSVLPASSRGTATDSWTLVLRGGFSTPGSHTIYMYADSDCSIKESNKNNNIMPFTVNVASTLGAISTPCQVTTLPASQNFKIGETGVVTASVTSGLGSATINQMRFGSYNTSLATVNPTADSSFPYSTTVAGIAAGNTAVWATADLSDGRTCESTGATDTNITVSGQR